jgi:hypothetical protein
MRKIIVTAVAVASLAVPAVSMADAPNGDYASTAKDGVSVANLGHQVTPDSASLVGEYSARSIQNGQFVSDQAQAGDRSTLVQGYLGH